MDISKIKKVDIEILINISKKYTSFHSELDDISNKLKELEYNKNLLLGEIKRLRDIEMYTINKIEQRTGHSLTSDDLMKIVNEYA